ncbi:ADP-ribosylglycohydrolase family protein [Oceanobacillus luteolus]|uniref:ADP-ribosylglycohydrolase family protein n=1 Tax=Oceanobacillus luteolus TaxID=1274358 RepID=UPI00203D8F94|nr:ADP-ribosylglycohydrolase family protein [Oceanobacillus luteolus]MCM3740578.1 ADP-ribosylglycohydrolase family protein [Oceanobacillus luteolus]
MSNFKDKVKGVLISTALGDALGAPVEKLSYQEIKERYGRVESLKTKWYKEEMGYDAHKGKKRGNGIVTDDTLMTLALCNVYNIERRHLDAYDMSNEFVKEIAFRKTYIPEFDREDMIIERLFYPEKHIFLRHTLANCEPREGGYGNMINCGAAMYIAPVGIVNAGNPKAAYDEAILFAMGHQTSYGLEAAGVLAACVAKAFQSDVTVEEIIETSIEFAKDGTKQAIIAVTNAARELKASNCTMDEVVAAFQEAILPYSPMGDDVSRKLEKVGIPSNHYTPSRLGSIEELPFALGFILYNDGAFYKSIYDGINSGRDTDSIGVMIGVILGAMYGASVVESEDVALLETSNQLDFNSITEEFAETARQIIKSDIEKIAVLTDIIE